MKQFFYKSIAFFMATVVLMTTMSFTIDMHYCGDTMVDFSFFQDVETCGMEKNPEVGTCQIPEMSRKSCCSDEQLVMEGQDDLKDNYSILTFEQQVFVASFTYSYINRLEETTSNEVVFFDHVPPFVKRDVQVWHQSFLI
jgi:hypothetical protein